MADLKITALKNGPYKVEGPIELFYGDSRVDTCARNRGIHSGMCFGASFWKNALPNAPSG